MGPYLAMISASARTLLHYRAAAFAGIVTQLFFGFIMVQAYTAFYAAASPRALSCWGGRGWSSVWGSTSPVSPSPDWPSIGCASLFYGLSVLGGMMSFWTTKTLEILNCLTHGGNFAGQYPISIYRESFRRFFTWIVPSHASPTIPPSPSSAAPTRQSWSAGWPRWQASPSSPSASACGVSA
ncbi:MAG: ABC-2 family transporter protein [Candidatus Latescibacterota bacterium]